MRYIYSSGRGGEWVFIQVGKSAIMISGYEPVDEEDERHGYDFSDASLLFMLNQPINSKIHSSLEELDSEQFWGFVQDKDALKKDLLRTVFK